MAAKYDPPWYISLPAGLEAYYDSGDQFESGTQWTSPQVPDGVFGDLPTLVEAYNAKNLGATELAADTSDATDRTRTT